MASRLPEQHRLAAQQQPAERAGSSPMSDESGTASPVRREQRAMVDAGRGQPSASASEVTREAQPDDAERLSRARTALRADDGMTVEQHAARSSPSGRPR